MADIPKPSGSNVDIGPSMLALCWSLYSIAALVVVARLYTQLISKLFEIGDIIMVFAVVFGFTHIATLTASHHYGLGRHFYYLSDNLRVKSQMWEFIAEPFGPLCSMCGRISFIILMFRLFGTNDYRRWFLYFLIAQTFLINMFTCITIYTQCEKVESIWDPVGTPSKCWPPAVQADIGFFQGATNSATDLILTIMPCSIFFNLQMKLKLKLGVGALLSLSIFALASSIVKTVKLKSIGDKADYTFNTVPFMSWVVIENTFVIIGASIPLLRPLVSKVKREATAVYSRNSTYEMNSNRRGTTKKTFTATQHKSIQLQSSSEEDIFPQNKGLVTANAAYINPHKYFDEESNRHAGIRKDTMVRVSYDEDGISTTGQR